MKNKVIDNRAEDGSWVVVSGGSYRKLTVDPTYKEIVVKWGLGDAVKVVANENLPPYTIRIYNITNENYANVQ